MPSVVLLLNRCWVYVRTEEGLTSIRIGFRTKNHARKAGLPPEAVRRLFTMRAPNPTATTLVALTRALELDLVAEPRRKPARAAQTDASKRRALTGA